MHTLLHEDVTATSVRTVPPSPRRPGRRRRPVLRPAHRVHPEHQPDAGRRASSPSTASTSSPGRVCCSSCSGSPAWSRCCGPAGRGRRPSTAAGLLHLTFVGVGLACSVAAPGGGAPILTGLIAVTGALVWAALPLRPTDPDRPAGRPAAGATGAAHGRAPDAVRRGAGGAAERRRRPPRAEPALLRHGLVGHGRGGAGTAGGGRARRLGACRCGRPRSPPVPGWPASRWASRCRGRCSTLVLGLLTGAVGHPGWRVRRSVGAPARLRVLESAP